MSPHTRTVMVMSGPVASLPADPWPPVGRFPALDSLDDLEPLLQAVAAAVTDGCAQIMAMPDKVEAFHALARLAHKLRRMSDVAALHRAQVAAELRAEEDLSLARLGRRLGVSTARAGQLVATATRSASDPAGDVVLEDDATDPEAPDHQPITRRSAMDTYTEDDVATWRQVVESLRLNAVDDHDLRMVDEGAAVISSGAGLFTTLPEPIARLLLQAIEAGYGQALRDMRDGRVEGLGPLL